MRLESKRASIPTLFLELGDTVGGLLSHPDLAERWEEPSALEGLTIGAVAAHLGRAFTTTWLYLQADPIGFDDHIDASSYFHAAFDRSAEDLAELNAGIAQRAHDDAEVGQEGVLRVHERTTADLKLRLVGMPAERGIEVFDDICMPLDDYLVTRMVEVLVHTDDLAVSLGIEAPTYAPDVVDLVMVALLGVARERHGDVAMLREFTRGERATGDRLPVF